MRAARYRDQGQAPSNKTSLFSSKTSQGYDHIDTPKLKVEKAKKKKKRSKNHR